VGAIVVPGQRGCQELLEALKHEAPFLELGGSQQRPLDRRQHAL